MGRAAALWDELNEDADPIGELLAGPVGGSPPGGVPFLTNVLADTSARIIVRAAFGADLTSTEPQHWNWYDITSDVRQADGQNVTISPMGRSDEASVAQPAGCIFQLDNTAGDYSKTATGKWWPYIRRNTPVKVELYVGGLLSQRFEGYANGWVPSWDTSANLAVVTVSASGILRRLQQGKSALRSTYTRGVGASAQVVGFWPFEDGKDASRIAEYTGLQSAITVDPTLITFQEGTPPAGTDKVAKLAAGALIAAPVSYTSTNEWTLSLLVNIPSAPASDTVLISWTTTGSYPTMRYLMTPNYLGTGQTYVRFQGFDSGGSLVLDDAIPYSDGSGAVATGDGFGKWLNIVLSIYTDTPNNQIFYEHSLYNPDSDEKLLGSGYLSAKTAGKLTSWSISASAGGGLVGANVGQIAVWSLSLDWTDIVNTKFRKYLNGYAPGAFHAGETATDRLARICNEEGVPIEIVGTSDIVMGAQPIDTFVNIIRECETADGGVLTDGRGPGLRYTARSQRYNTPVALTLDASAGQVGDPFQPTDDDQRNRNVVAVDRKNGSRATAQDVTGTVGTDAIGTYDTSLTVNVASDSILENRAAWEVHLGTVDEPYRYPTLNLDLSATPGVASGWLATPLDSRLDVTNVDAVASQHPGGTISLLLEGYSETLTPFDWTISANCSPYSPWQVFTLNDELGRLETGGSSIAAAASAGSSTLSVATTGQVLWTTSAVYPGDFPLYIKVAGLQVTVTAIVGTTSPQTFTVDPTTVTKNLHAGDAVTLWQTGALAL
jgi:hypothetical protein